MKKHGAKIALVVGGLGLLVLMRFIPRQPVAEKPVSSLEQKIARATELVEKGENPMEGIQLFREILAEDSNNIEVHYRLGLFSLQSGQVDKAVQRFEKVLSLSTQTYPDAYLYLGQAKQALGDTTGAIEAYNTFKTTTSDTIVLHGVDRIINELSN
ncbi:MAG TPA: tetratricopeptide repeat protein [Luteibaculaceae bacterium]|nr:tetratricopeptide repeat protein [Luteibaculaceae bacterium]